ncbi:hypothetical protein AB0I10_09875 [Streptomyces sp. NPDC050636]|uniref:hypothetical protein n=1 Tax=Streptomyces sp. NPDC050636 TaxID=3154510 RepID=UPI0034320AEB
MMVADLALALGARPTGPGRVGAGCRRALPACAAAARDAWATAEGRSAYEEELTPPALRLSGGGGAPGGPRVFDVPHHDEGTALVADAFRACMEEGAAPRVPVRQAVAASLVGTSAAVSPAEGGRAVAVPDVRSWNVPAS